MKINRIYALAKKKITLPFEKLLSQNYPSRPKYTPIFILGLPRSGTTLLYQYIVHRLKVSYFMNGTDRYPSAAVLNTWLRFKWCGEYNSNFDNEYGKVEGLNAPHEAGSFWGRFFGFQKYITYSQIASRDEYTLRRSIAAIEQVFGGRPFINKNVKHLLRIDALAHIFPKAHFIIIHRNLKDIALSVLRGRYENLGKADQWWSVRPQNWKDLNNLEPAQQIAKQLISLRKKLLQDLGKISAENIYQLTYEEFCLDPEVYLIELAHQFDISPKTNKPIRSFNLSKNIPETEEEKKLIAYLS